MVVELHSDFLSYLTFSKKHTPHDEESRSSIRQIRKGEVSTIVKTVYSSTAWEEPSKESKVQMSKYHELILDDDLPFVSPLDPTAKQDPVVSIPSIENASSFAEEDEPLERAFDRFLEHFTKVPPIYISLTWHEENRFGGGNMTSIGLKEDGKVLLDFLEGKVGSIDLSHTSDILARDIISHIEKKGLRHKLIASHSNFREVTNVARNLPYDVASHIVQSGGVIGLNLLDAFIGTKVEDMLNHIEYALDHGFQDHLAFGGDFFSPLTTQTGPNPRKSYHFKEAETVECYPFLLDMIENRFSKTLADAIAECNAEKHLLSHYRAMVLKERCSC